MTNAVARNAHGNPTVLNSLFRITGKEIPPNDAPDSAIPIASPRFFRNQVLTHITAVWNLLLAK